MWRALNELDRKLGDRPAVLVHGDAQGIDRAAARHWQALNIKRPGLRTLEPHPWDQKWKTFGRGGGMVRNKYMVSLGANLCLAFIHDDSPGASQCSAEAEKAGIKVVYYRSKPRTTRVGKS